MGLEARRTLKKARFFLQKARPIAPDNRGDCIAFLEAAIIFGRSVTFHIQKELSKDPRFNAWYQHWQARLGKCPECRFLLKQRNFALKEAQINTHGVHTVSIKAVVVNIECSAVATVIRGKPWYRRHPRILIGDLFGPTWRLIRRWVERQRQRIAAKSKRAVLDDSCDQTTSRFELHFEDDEWSGTPAVDVVETYLDQLEELVLSAESTFKLNGADN